MYFDNDIQMSETPQVVFIVPYRDRDQQYRFFDRHMREIVLAGCGYPYRIVYVHQADTRTFNRGALKNMGFLWVREQWPQEYRNMTLVFHDVDNMPYTGGFLDYRTRPGVVKHFYGFTFALGGMFSITGADFERVGGFPNYWAWGFEDNSMYQRAVKARLVVDRSQFYPIFDKNILHFVDGMTRSVNRKEFDRYMARETEGFASLRDTVWDYEEATGFLHVRGFLTGHAEDVAALTTHDLRSGTHPFRVGRGGGKWGMQFSK